MGSCVLAGLKPGMQLTDDAGIITRPRLKDEAYEVVCSSMEPFVGMNTQVRYPASEGWRRVLCESGFGYVHDDPEKVAALGLELRRWIYADKRARAYAEAYPNPVEGTRESIYKVHLRDILRGAA